MNTFVGNCIGGPHDGRTYAHWERVIRFYRPMYGFALSMRDAPVEAVLVGEYRLNDFGQWHWWPTENGRAYERLVGQQ